MIKPAEPAIPGASELLAKVGELEVHERRMASLLEVGQLVMAQREPMELLRQVCDAAREMTQAGLAAVAIVSEDLQRLERLEIAGLDESLAAGLRRTFQIDDTIRRVLKVGQPTRGQNPGGDPLALGLPAGHPPIHSFLIAPVKSASRVYGWFALAEKTGATAFSDIDERIATTLGAQVGMAYENSNLVARLREQAKALRDHEDDLEFAMSVARVGVSYRDLHSSHVMISRSLGNLLGLPPGTASMSREDLLARVHPDDVERVRAADAEAVARGTEVELEYRVQTQTGGWRWFRSKQRVTSNRQGQAARLFSGMVDITENRSVELQLQQAQKMDALGQLAGGVAHDFNNLLTAIGGYADFLLESVGEPEQRRDVEEIVKAAGRAASLTKPLLAFSRRQVRATIVVDVNTVVEDMAAMLRRMIREDIEITTRLSEDPLSVRSDHGQLEQVVMNLVVNGRDAIQGVGKIHIETASVDLEDSSSPPGFTVKAGPYVMLTVTDTGCGMTGETKARLFEPFFTTKGRGQGTGLGLATVHGIVVQNGGSIWVESEPEQGTTFKVYLPRYEHPTPARDVPAAAAPVRGGTETVLLVEDEQAVRGLARIILERSGYTVVDAASPTDAELRWASMASVDLLLTDVIMPGGSGPDLFRRLSAERPDLRVLFMSAYNDGDILDQTAIVQPTAFLEKPFSARVLLAKVRQVLDR